MNFSIILSKIQVSRILHSKTTTDSPNLLSSEIQLISDLGSVLGYHPLPSKGGIAPPPRTDIRGFRIENGVLAL